MRPELMRAVEFAQHVDGVRSLAMLDSQIAQVLKPFGISNYGAHRVFDPGHQPRPGLFFGNIDQTWVKPYLQSGFVRHDPAVKMLFETTRPYSWTDARKRFVSREGEMVLNECLDATGTGD